MSSENLVARIVNLRESKDWSQAELARKLGIEKSVMNKIENGSRKIQTDELMKLGDLFDVSVDYLIYGKDSIKNEIPSWASDADVLEVERFLDQDTKMTLASEALSEEEMEDIRRILRASLWRKLKRVKDREEDV